MKKPKTKFLWQIWLHPSAYCPESVLETCKKPPRAQTRYQAAQVVSRRFHKKAYPIEVMQDEFGNQKYFSQVHIRGYSKMVGVPFWVSWKPLDGIVPDFVPEESENED